MTERRNRSVLSEREREREKIDFPYLYLDQWVDCCSRDVSWRRRRHELGERTQLNHFILEMNQRSLRQASSSALCCSLWVYVDWNSLDLMTFFKFNQALLCHSCAAELLIWSFRRWKRIILKTFTQLILAFYRHSSDAHTSKHLLSIGTDFDRLRFETNQIISIPIDTSTDRQTERTR